MYDFTRHRREYNMNILIGADLVPTESNAEYFVKGDIRHLFGDELVTVLNYADYRIFNLEVPLTKKASPIPKCGPNLIADTDTVSGYKAAGTDLLTLANNHILDQGTDGLGSTLKTLEDAGISYVGVGNTPIEAARPFIFECDGKKIGVYACAEHEFSLVTDCSAGANPIDLLESPDHVVKLKAQCDYVIVLYHGGKEHYRYPSPDLQKVCRKLVEKGADLVICQHSHCIGCEEKYAGGTIVYGQGNFLFDYSDNECWQTGMLVEIDDDFGISYRPLVKSGNCVRLADEENRQKILEGFYKRSEEIKSPDFVESEYSKFADTFRISYMRALSGKNSFIFRVLNRLTGGWLLRETLRRKYPVVNKYQVINFMDCEAHRELMLRAISMVKDKE